MASRDDCVVGVPTESKCLEAEISAGLGSLRASSQRCLCADRAAKALQQACEAGALRWLADGIVRSAPFQVRRLAMAS